MDIQKIHQYKTAFDVIAKQVKDDDCNTIGMRVSYNHSWAMPIGRI